MDKPTSGENDPRIYLVERYLAAAAADRLPSAVARLAGLCADADHTVRYLQSTYLPSEDICFCLFAAASAEAVRAVNAAAGFTVDRITAALVMHDGAAAAVAGPPHRPGETP